MRPTKKPPLPGAFQGACRLLSVSPAAVAGVGPLRLDVVRVVVQLAETEVERRVVHVGGVCASPAQRQWALRETRLVRAASALRRVLGNASSLLLGMVGRRGCRHAHGSAARPWSDRSPQIERSSQVQAHTGDSLSGTPYANARVSRSYFDRRACVRRSESDRRRRRSRRRRRARARLRAAGGLRGRALLYGLHDPSF